MPGTPPGSRRVVDQPDARRAPNPPAGFRAPSHYFSSGSRPPPGSLPRRDLPAETATSASEHRMARERDDQIARNRNILQIGRYVVSENDNRWEGRAGHRRGQASTGSIESTGSNGSVLSELELGYNGQFVQYPEVESRPLPRYSDERRHTNAYATATTNASASASREASRSRDGSMRESPPSYEMVARAGGDGSGDATSRGRHQGRRSRSASGSRDRAHRR